MHELRSEHRGARRTNAGRSFPADPPRVEEIVAVMKAAGGSAFGLRLRGLIVILWRAGLRISEALALAETDLEPTRGSLLVRSGKGGKRREVGMDEWGWVQLGAWIAYRRGLPVGPLLCAISRGSAGRPWSDSAVRQSLRRMAAQAGFVAASRRISCVTRMRSRWPAKGFRST